MSSYAVVNPATGENVKEYPEISDSDLTAAIAKASEAHGSWSQTTSVAERAAMVRKVGELHVERAQALAEIAVREMGKPMEQAVGEVEFCGDIYGFYADNAEDFLKDEPIDLLAGEGTALIRRTSVGPLLGIMPWNFPYYQVARFAGPNLIVGNTILLKPAPQCPESAEAIQDIYREAGFPRWRLRDHPRHQRPDRRGHRRPAGPRRLADRLRARRRCRRRDRRAQPEEGRARARRLRPVHPAQLRRPRRCGRGRGRRSPRQHRPVVQRRQAVHRRRRPLRRLPREVLGADEVGGARRPDVGGHRDRPALVDHRR